jgi:hypothetical protein
MANDLKLEAKTTNTKSPAICINYTLLQDTLSPSLYSTYAE